VTSFHSDFAHLRVCAHAVFLMLGYGGSGVKFEQTHRASLVHAVKSAGSRGISVSEISDQLRGSLRRLSKQMVSMARRHGWASTVVRLGKVSSKRYFFNDEFLAAFKKTQRDRVQTAAEAIVAPPKHRDRANINDAVKILQAEGHMTETELVRTVSRSCPLAAPVLTVDRGASVNICRLTAWPT